VKVVASDGEYHNSRLNFNVLNCPLLFNNNTVFVKGYHPPFFLT